MGKFIDLILQKKWAAALILILMTVVLIMAPAFVSQKIDLAFHENLGPVNDTVERIEQMKISEIIDRGVAAYNKCKTVEDLESSTQNGMSIKIALRTPQAREILYMIDHERTRIFFEYFYPEGVPEAKPADG